MRFPSVLWLALGVSLAAGCCTSRHAAADSPSPSPTAKSDSKPAPAAEPGWTSLFDGRSLKGWGVTDFAGKGEVKVENGSVILEEGLMTGVHWTNASALPLINYEIALEAMRVEGTDFFCGLTFPVGKDPCSLIVGGWGGGVVGLSSLDSMDAANNETTKYLNFENGRWFAIRLRVTSTNIMAWIDKDLVVNVDTEGRAISIRPEVEPCKPLGIASWSTKAALRNLRLRRL